MKVSVHSLYFPNINPTVVECHKKVYQKFEIPVQYTAMNRPPIRQIPCDHGIWMDETIKNNDSDVFVFTDIDCVPLTRDIFMEGLKYVIQNDSFIGTAQASNHIHPRSHVFASPAFFFITKNCHNKMGSPSFKETNRSDVAQEVSYIAEERGINYRCWYPTKFDGVPMSGLWKLSNYGTYGIGTLFADKIYHLYESRFNANVDLFQKRCDQILSDNFITDGMTNSTNLI
jgi:hypothetical protein